MENNKPLSKYDKELIILKKKLKQGSISKKEYLEKKKEIMEKKLEEKRNRMRKRIQSSNAPKEMKECVSPRLYTSICKSKNNGLISKEQKYAMLKILYK